MSGITPEQAALLTEAELRPWMVDKQADELYLSLIHDFEKALVLTSPIKDVNSGEIDKNIPLDIKSHIKEPHRRASTPNVTKATIGLFKEFVEQQETERLKRETGRRPSTSSVTNNRSNSGNNNNNNIEGSKIGKQIDRPQTADSTTLEDRLCKVGKHGLDYLLFDCKEIADIITEMKDIQGEQEDVPEENDADNEDTESNIDEEDENENNNKIPDIDPLFTEELVKLSLKEGKPMKINLSKEEIKFIKKPKKMKYKKSTKKDLIPQEEDKMVTLEKNRLKRKNKKQARDKFVNDFEEFINRQDEEEEDEEITSQEIVKKRDYNPLPSERRSSTVASIFQNKESLLKSRVQNVADTNNISRPNTSASIRSTASNSLKKREILSSSESFPNLQRRPNTAEYDLHSGRRKSSTPPLSSRRRNSKSLKAPQLSARSRTYSNSALDKLSIKGGNPNNNVKRGTVKTTERTGDNLSMSEQILKAREMIKEMKTRLSTDHTWALLRTPGAEEEEIKDWFKSTTQKDNIWPDIFQEEIETNGPLFPEFNTKSSKTTKWAQNALKLGHKVYEGGKFLKI